MPSATEPSATEQGDVALLVDWENLKFSLLQRDRRPSVTALRLAAERFGRIVYARAYANWQDPVHQDDPAALYRAGLEPVYVLTRHYTGEGGSVTIKNSVDVKLAADCIEASHVFPNIQTYIIVTGDHGFIHVVNTLRPRGKRVVVIGVSWTTAAQLTEQADVVLYYDIDVERILEDGATETVPAPAKAVSTKVSPQMAQTAETAVAKLRVEEGNKDKELDQRQVAEMLQLILAIAKEFRKDRRELSVSVLGQELQKRMSTIDFQRYGRGRARPLVQALSMHGHLKLISRQFVDWIYLPEEPDELIAEDLPREQEFPRYSYAGLVYADLAEEKRQQVIVAIYDERQRPGTDYLTFKRIMAVVGPIIMRDEYATKNVINNMVDISVLKMDPERHGRDPDSGIGYAFKTFSVDLYHPDVRRALKLGA